MNAAGKAELARSLLDSDALASPHIALAASKLLARKGKPMHRLFSALFALAAIPALSTSAAAGIPECGGIRIEAEAQCGVEFACSAGCTTTVYKKNCATRLYKRCHEECATPPRVFCTDGCGAFCRSQCAKGVDVICQHNCFPECVDSCEMTCASDVVPAIHFLRSAHHTPPSTNVSPLVPAVR